MAFALQANELIKIHNLRDSEYILSSVGVQMYIEESNIGDKVFKLINIPLVL